jgi:arginyl-tRNA synthetase
MHVGHCRGAVVGDALANLLTKANYAVTKEYYVNDAGAQVQALAQAAYWRYLQALSTPMTEAEYAATVPAACNTAATTSSPWARPCASARRRVGRIRRPARRPALWLDAVRDFAVDAMMDAIRDDLAALGVRHDVFVSERALLAEGKLEQAEALLSARGLIYHGSPRPPQGQDARGLGAARADPVPRHPFGDEVDRPLRKSDGTGTYFANDIANHLHKLERGFVRAGPRLGRRPRRLRQAHEGRRRRALGRQGAARRGAHPDRPRGEERRARCG